ncbi:PEPxxWA-CTERM sorting domain-containing protein [Sphingomonas sp. AP4-R1]|uniref:PEPxxWA-CTERM sorting domain-containing protein n=1 Tax=Sphingomonas sp. AP4-R1 TaxID=2735134 RepID=UPI00149349B0|nr:PEPxxWA-CTERM sorting domain-containing protein [Sphingomonas sp. AP4-R1]QJU60054.1 PEPxxWA-CTERM sorting domain-containing protein [Sphingomonas sp. AP4-R1]
MKRLLLAAVVATLVTGSAQATFITKTLRATYSRFATGQGPIASPYPTITIQFELSFDNSGHIAPTTTGLTVLSLDFPAAKSVEFQYFINDDNVSIGTDLVDNFGYNSSTEGSFGFFIEGISSNSPILNSLTFYQGAQYTSNTGRLTDLTASPEPSTWAMFIGGFGFVGIGMRRHRRMRARAI